MRTLQEALTLRLVLPKLWELWYRKISTAHIFPNRLKNIGEDGIFPCVHGLEAMYSILFQQAGRFGNSPVFPVSILAKEWEKGFQCTQLLLLSGWQQEYGMGQAGILSYGGWRTGWS